MRVYGNYGASNSPNFFPFDSSSLLNSLTKPPKCMASITFDSHQHHRLHLLPPPNTSSCSNAMNFKFSNTSKTNPMAFDYQTQKEKPES